MVFGGTLILLERQREQRQHRIVWPLPDWPLGVVKEWRTGARTFGAAREDHVHAGVDLGPPKAVGITGRAYGSPVLAPVSGQVTVVGGGWRGPEAKRIEIVSPVYGTIVLGAVQKDAPVRVGQHVDAGDLVGWLGRYPAGSTMLHLEQHAGERTRWMLGTQKPPTIIDPRTSVLRPFV